MGKYGTQADYEEEQAHLEFAIEHARGRLLYAERHAGTRGIKNAQAQLDEAVEEYNRFMGSEEV